MQTFDLKKLDANYPKLLKLSTGIFLVLIPTVPVLLISYSLLDKWYLSLASLISVWTLLYFLLITYLKKWCEKYQYSLSEEGLNIHRGVFWQQQIIVPRNRVQHIDITNGPLERKYKLSKLILHTAGTRNASVTLNGLNHEEAAALRQELINSNANDTV
ncbi:MAG: PH domain-containing protein [Proteobacteria bacterium]|nr:PH domain-containing protein [Pseudomonadota bacterium]